MQKLAPGHRQIEDAGRQLADGNAGPALVLIAQGLREWSVNARGHADQVTAVLQECRQRLEQASPTACEQPGSKR